MRDGAVTRTMRADSEQPNVVGEVAFFLGIPQPRSWQVLSLHTSVPLDFPSFLNASTASNAHRLVFPHELCIALPSPAASDFVVGCWAHWVLRRQSSGRRM